jgi:hypothetical protein
MKISLAVVKKYVLAIFIILPLFIHCQDTKESITVKVDLSKPLRNVKSMSGFLHYTDINKLEESIKQLKPKYWRIGNFYRSADDVKLLKKYGVTPVLVISDLYGYPGRKNNKDWPHPLIGNKLENLIKNLYAQLGNSVIYDVWNEPYHQEGFGDFDHDEYFKIFKKAHDIIRSQPNGKNAIITGPSFDNYDAKEIEGFLKYCNDNSVKVNILNWHEWRSGESLKGLKKDLDYVRNVLLTKYPNVKVEKIMFYEIINQWIQFSPSEILQVLKTLEDNSIDGACKGCWAESDGIYNCDKNSLDGLLDKDGNPRSAWWAYKYYAESVNNRVTSAANYDDLVSFVSADKSTVKLLLANNSKFNLVNVEVRINDSNFSFLSKKLTNLRVNVFEIPDTGERALTTSIPVSSKSLKIKDKKLSFQIKLMKPRTTYYIVVQK